MGVRVVSYLPGDTFTGITVEETATGERTNHPLDGLFVAIGLVPQNEIFKDLIDLTAASDGAVAALRAADYLEGR